MLWTEKHRPKSVEEVAGNPEAVEEVKRWAIDWGRGVRGKPILLYGPAGVGKSALAHALANSMGWDVVEMNASDLRNKESVLRIAGASSSSQTLSGKIKLTLIDEVDGLQSKDRGGGSAISEVLRNAAQPVILTANDYWSPSLSYLRAQARGIELRRINSRTVAAVLKKIAAREKIEVGEGAIKSIGEQSRGDLRSAINDLQALSEGKIKIEGEGVSVAYRDREKNVFDAIRAVFKSTEYGGAASASWGLDIDHDLFKRWIEENIPNEYEKTADVARAYESLSRADVFDGRIPGRQYYGFLRYSNDLMTAGVALAKEERYHKFTKYAFPKIVRALSASKGERALEKSAGLKLGKKLHCSWREARAYFPLVKMLYRGEGEARAAQAYFGFEDEDVEFLFGSAGRERKKRTAKQGKRRSSLESEPKPA
ncbi:MAG: replication factor C large subunit [Candidatus Micrarchaeota archaeon]